MKRFLQFSAVVLLSCTALTPAMAQELDADGQKLKTMFETIIESQKKNQFSQFSTLAFDGDVHVEKSGKYYAVTLPYMTLNYNDGAKFEIGMVAINAAPHDAPDQWKMTFALPTPMTLTDENGEKASQINIGAQRASGVWNDTLGYFSKLDANYESIVMSDPDNSYTFTMPSVQAVYDLESDNNGKWSGPVYFTFNDINLNIPEEGGEILRVGGINLNMEMFKYDPVHMKDYQNKIEQLMLLQEGGENAQSAADVANVSGLLDSFVGMIGNGFTSQYQIKDVTMRGGKSEQKFDTLKIAEAGFGLDLTGFLDNKVALDMRMGYQGFDMQPPPAGVSEVSPKNLNLDISLQNIPFSEISQMAKESAQAAVENPEMAQMAGMSTLFKLPALLSQAGTTLVLKDNHFGNDTYHVQIDGNVLTDMEAVNSATADVTGSIKGLDRLTQILTTEMQSAPAGPNTGFIQQIIMGLTMAKGMGEIGTNANGEAVHLYKIIMGKDGKIFLNGQDMSMFMGAATGMAPGAVEQQQLELQQP